MRINASLERSTAYARRRYVRHPVRIGAGLSENIRPSAAITVIDLSTGGCGIETDLHLEEGARVWLKLPGLESWPGRVAWCADGRAGLSFDAPLHPAVIERFVK